MKVLLSKPGLDGHDVGVKVLAHGLKDAGYEVFYTGLRKTIEELIDMAIQKKADIIGMSILSGTQKEKGTCGNSFSAVLEFNFSSCLLRY